jgi:putative ABC transport system substrate-binding protein
MHFGRLRRREFITLIGGTPAWPLTAGAQQRAMSVIGFLNPTTPEAVGGADTRIASSLQDSGYVEGENLTIEYCWADNQAERLPAMAAELVPGPTGGKGGNHSASHRLQYRR